MKSYALYQYPYDESLIKQIFFYSSGNANNELIKFKDEDEKDKTEDKKDGNENNLLIKTNIDENEEKDENENSNLLIKTDVDENVMPVERNSLISETIFVNDEEETDDELFTTVWQEKKKGIKKVIIKHFTSIKRKFFHFQDYLLFKHASIINGLFHF